MTATTTAPEVTVIQDLSAATPVEIDVEIARIGNEIASAYTGRDRRSHRIAQLRKGYMIAGSDTVESLAAEIDAIEVEIEKLEAEVAPLHAEFIRRGGWNRYYMVDNNNGHLHTTTGCRNTYRTTQWYWMTGMSNMERWDAVQEAGSLACLTCFPEYREFIELGRPGTIETPNQRKTREQREADAKVKAEKAAKAATKAIANPDGTPLVIQDLGSRTVKTEIAAQRALMQAAFDLRWYGPGHPSAAEWNENVRLCLNALAHKHGTTVQDERAVLAKKVEAKYRREMR